MTTTSKATLYDKEGHDITSEDRWLREIVDFESFNRFVPDGIVLADADDDFVDIWGPCVHESITGEYIRNTKHLYRASFILGKCQPTILVCAYCCVVLLTCNCHYFLAHDPSCFDFELKCPSGCSGVAEVMAKVIKTRDYSLLKRLLTVAETKLKCDFDVKSCQTLIIMLTRSTGKSAQLRIFYVRRIFSLLSPSQDPDSQLYDDLLAAVTRFGHCHFMDVISAFLSDTRRKCRQYVFVFLERANFILKLNAHFENKSNYMSKIVAYLTFFGAGEYASQGSVINETISSLISRHGWDAM